jgi:hypothetical protein
VRARRSNETLKLTKPRDSPRPAHCADPAPSQVNSSVSTQHTREKGMALSRTFVCTGCAHTVEAWDEGNPYYADERGERQYVYHPSPEHERATGNEWPALCLGCGAEVTQDSAAPVRSCPECASTDLVDAWDLEGRACPYCRAGAFAEDPRAIKIS